jgi:leucyl-tRNA synthetase
MALADERITKFIAGKDIRKIIVVKNKLISIVI